MLQSTLLSVIKRKGELFLCYAKHSDENLQAARNLIETYKQHIGDKKKTLKNIITELESQGSQFRFVRGLSVLLDRKSTFSCDCKVDPVDLRRKIFLTSQSCGLATTTEKRKQLLTLVASESGLNISQIEEAFYGDLDGELILREVTNLSEAELIAEYNLSLTQSILFNCTELSFNASGNWQRTFFMLKKLGLIYEISPENGFTVKIDGPSSLFKLTRRYGVAIAKLLPFIVANDNWNLSAKVFWKYDNEICSFKIDSKRHGTILKRPWIPAVTYDSKAEENFASQFKALNSDWTLRREPEPISAGKQVIIPDFSIERSGVKIYVELMGFWTEDYLLRKIEKLKRVDAKMLLLINESLACEKLSALEEYNQLNLIFYRTKLPWAKILQYLEDAFESTKKREIKFLETLTIKFTEEVLSFEDFASRIGVSVAAIKSFLIVNPPVDYVAFQNCLIHKEKLDQINKQLELHLSESGKIPLNEATKIIETCGVSDITSTLTALNFRINWQGISIQQAQVVKLKK